MHVGQPGDDELAVQVELDGAAGDRQAPADPDDPVAADQYGLVAIAPAGRDVDDSDVGQGLQAPSPR